MPVTTIYVRTQTLPTESMASCCLRGSPQISRRSLYTSWQGDGGIAIVTTNTRANQEPVLVDNDIADSASDFETAVEEDEEISDRDFEVATTRRLCWDRFRAVNFMVTTA